MLISYNHLKKERAGQAGFSLIEAMVAIVIFAVGILGVYKLQLHATTGNAMANRVSVATNWAAYAIEELLAHDYEDEVFDDDNGDHGFADYDVRHPDNSDGALFIQPDGGTGPEDTAIYSIYWNVIHGNPDDDTEPEFGVLSGVKLIRLHVERSGGIGSGLLYSHTYYKARYPESDD